jgi:hypothetical protein
VSRRYTFTFMCTVKRPNVDDKIFYGKIFYKSLRPFLSLIFIPYGRKLFLFYFYASTCVFLYSVTRCYVPEYRHRYVIVYSSPSDFIMYRYSIVPDPANIPCGIPILIRGARLRIRLQEASYLRFRLARIRKKYFWILDGIKNLLSNINMWLFTFYSWLKIIKDLNIVKTRKWLAHTAVGIRRIYSPKITRDILAS